MADRTTSMLTESDVAHELRITGHDAGLRVRRLTAKGRIAHYPQPNGTARVAAADLESYLRQGSPDLAMPNISGDWFDDGRLSMLARSFEQRLQQQIEEQIPEANPGAATARVTVTPAIRTMMGEALPSMRTLVRTDREDPARKRLQRASDPLLVVRMRRAVKAVIREQGIRAGSSSLIKLFASRAAYQDITSDAISKLLGSSLATVRETYVREDRPGAPDHVVFMLQIRDVAGRADLERIASIAF